MLAPDVKMHEDVVELGDKSFDFLAGYKRIRLDFILDAPLV